MEVLEGCQDEEVLGYLLQLVQVSSSRIWV